MGDFCYRFFPIAPPTEELKKTLSAKFEELRSLINSLDKKLCAATTEDIEQIAAKGAVIAVAGGADKKFAIRDVLNRGAIDEAEKHSKLRGR